MLPKRCRGGAVLQNKTTIEKLPQLQCWPNDGGAFITLPIVYSENVSQPGLSNSNLGMYRVQLSGGKYEANREIGLHYQIHRGIGIHHALAIEQNKPFRVNVFVGGTPSMAIAAVMPLPEGMSELGFAGALAGHRIPMISQNSTLPIYADADFCISGTVEADKLLPEGPFGDHLGYYSLAHEFPVLRVDNVYHRDGAVWPFTVVGRPPQEDTMFGKLIHELTEPVIPTVLPGVRAVHAVDVAGVHPLLLAIGSERYVPYQPLTQPMELLTQANAILGQGQMSLAKYLLIVADRDNPQLNIEDISRFIQHLLARIDWRRDVHFQTRTTIDTLDYTGSSINGGSKVVLAAAGETIRNLSIEIEGDPRLPAGFDQPQVGLPGVLIVRSPAWTADATGPASIARFCQHFRRGDNINKFPLVILADDSEFTARNIENLLWVTFTRSNPANDVDGIESFVDNKHWGCHGSLVIDARIKDHHAPPLETDPEIAKRVDALATRGGPLARYL
jgi:4-hydroxy-3-polyprenylbenzoate decarboxylase